MSELLQQRIQDVISRSYIWTPLTQGWTWGSWIDQVTQYPRQRTSSLPFFLLFFFFFSLFFIIAAALLVARVAFGLKFAYGVHTQPWLLSNLNHLSRIYFITGTIQQKFSPKLEIFSTLFFVFLALLQHSHKTQPKSKCHDRSSTSLYNYLYLAFS